ncbi:hypothetical protein L3Q82_026504 [Scortum barcoo]|uniref:Uncharacterized protein n=1 Tax=Scortum barcoo TaxID=214431 RepID=A0ACB8WJM8_9TELE|nr:hypothetical protein L3Q82_026504 [Scortum barcoo]
MFVEKGNNSWSLIGVTQHTWAQVPQTPAADTLSLHAQAGQQMEETLVMSWTSPEVKSQTEEEEGFTIGSTDQHKEEDGGIPGFCSACKAVISWVKRKLGKDSSKEKIGRLLSMVCKQLKGRLIRSACGKLINKYKGKLIDLLVRKGNPRRICINLKLCKRNKPDYKYHI